MIKQWLYFGCHQRPGHYAFTEGMRPYTGPLNLSVFDGVLPPSDNRKAYVATVSRLGGWNATALSFWDYSVDKRGGCNSTIFAPSMTIGADELLEEARRRFPAVFDRLPEPVVLAKTPISAQAAQVPQSFWLIEKPATTEWPAIWLTLTTFMRKYVASGNHYYTDTAAHALKFHDRESAEEYIRHHEIQHVTATEHIFDARAMLQQEAPGK